MNSTANKGLNVYRIIDPCNREIERATHDWDHPAQLWLMLVRSRRRDPFLILQVNDGQRWKSLDSAQYEKREKGVFLPVYSR